MPDVFLIAATGLTCGFNQWLSNLGVPLWATDALSDGEALIEAAGRRCYRSFQAEGTNVAEQNANLSSVREGNAPYINNILKQQHGSVLEHVHVTFAIENISRVATHELVRHRLANFSQESLRFVRPTQFSAYYPHVFADLLPDPVPDADNTMPLVEAILGSAEVQRHPMNVRDLVRAIWTAHIADTKQVQEALVALLGMDNATRPFAEKKLLQSAMRRLGVAGQNTGIVMTSNLRQWRHMIAMRTAEAAEEEIREVFAAIFYELLDGYPAVFKDAVMTYPKSGPVVVTFANGKV